AVRPGGRAVSVTVLVPSALRTETGGEPSLAVSSSGTLRDVLDAVDAQWPRFGRRLRDERGQIRRFVNVYIDGEDCRGLSGLDSLVRDGAEVQVLPSVAGGSDFTLADARSVLADNFAPWVLDLGLVVEEIGADFAVLRLPWSDRLAREGGA